MMSTRVVVVDDDVDTLDIFCTMLDLKEFEVVGRGENGKEAVELFKQHKPDVILIDIMMPDYDGFYAIEKINEVDSNAKIVVVTADLTEETAKKCKELGAFDMLYKPYEIDDVSKVVECAAKGKKIYSSDLVNVSTNG